MKTLTPREHEAMLLIRQGYSHKEAAHQMGCSLKTLEKHKQTIHYKWGVSSNVALIRVAIRHRHISIGLFLASDWGENQKHERPGRMERVLK